MLLVAVLAAFFVSVLVWRLMRRVFVILAVLAAAAVAVRYIPSHNANLAAYRLLMGLVGHLAATSIHQGLAEYLHWGQHFWAQHHL